MPASIISTIDVPGPSGSQALQLSSAQLHLGRSTFRVQGKWENNLLAGQAAILIPDLAELQPLTQIDAHGRLTLDLTLSRRAGQQDGTVTLSGEGLSYGKAVKLDHLMATTKLADLFGAGTNATRIDIRDATIGPQKLTSLRALLDGPLRRMSLDLQAAGPNVNANLGASISHAPDRDSATIDHARLVAMGRQIDLQHPVTISHQATGTHVDNLSLKSGGSQVVLTADLTPESNRIDLELRHLALDLLAAFSPKINIKGDVDGWVRVDGPNHNPRAAAKLNVTQITSPAISMAPANAALTATWESGRMAASGDISLDTQHDILTLSATLPVPADPDTGFPRLDGTCDLMASAKGHVDLALLNPLLRSSVDQIGGQAEIDMTAMGALAAPKMQGHLAITDGRYDNLRYGTRLKAIQAQMNASGSRLQLSSFTARTPGNGSLSGSGDIDLTRSSPVAITIQAQKAQLIDNAMGSATADADLTLSSQGPQQLALAGRIKITRADIRVPDRLSSAVEEIAVVERNTGAKKSASPAVAAKPVPPAVSASPMKVSLDMTIDAPQQVAVRGRGLDAELGGKLRVGGNISQPAITGQLKLRRGRFDLVGHSLNFDRGAINFDGGTPIEPQLDFAAKAKAEGYDITALMTGTASKPNLTLTSTPSLPQDEILARLLFGKAAGSLTAIQAVQLAQATAQLAGVNSGPDILDQLRRATGLDRLSVDAGESATTKTTATGPSLSAGRYVAPGVYLGVKQGAKPNSSAATVEIDVTPHIKVETDVGGTAGSKAGINMQWDY
jgi:translocation and assembly module TamB